MEILDPTVQEEHMTTKQRTRRATKAAVLALALAAALPADAPVDLVDPGQAAAFSPLEVKEQSAPSGMILYFEREACPPGWTLANIARGRMIVSTVRRNEVGVTENDPMSDRRAPVHSHRYTASFRLPSKSITAANGGSNDRGALAGARRTTSATGNSQGDLPWRQMLVCQEQ